jgi:hypothetical protein
MKRPMIDPVDRMMLSKFPTSQYSQRLRERIARLKFRKKVYRILFDGI